MYIERKSEQEITENLKKIFYESFKKEGEIAYITLNLNSTKNEIISEIPESNYEREYIEKNYEKIVDMVKSEMKQSGLIFNDTTETREKKELIAEINNLYIDFEDFYEKEKNKNEKLSGEIEKWHIELIEIYNVVSIEFCIDSLKRIHQLIKSNNKKVYYKNINDKANHYTMLIKIKAKDIKQFKINEEQRKNISDRMDTYIRNLTNIDLNKDDLKHIAEVIEEQGESLLNDIENITDKNNNIKENVNDEISKKIKEQEQIERNNKIDKVVMTTISILMILFAIGFIPGLLIWGAIKSYPIIMS